MSKVTADKTDHELTERNLSRATSPTESTKKTLGYENPVFTDQQVPVPIPEKGVIITTKLEEKPNEHNRTVEDDDENAEFEKLPGEGNKMGLIILSVHRFFIDIVQREKKLAILILESVLLIGFVVYFGFAMSAKYGTPAFPINGNVFRGNYGFALFMLVVIVVFIALWELILSRSIERFFKNIARSNENKPGCIKFRQIFKRFSWILHLLVLAGIILYIGLTLKRTRNLVSAAGIVILILLGTLGSKYPHRIRWLTVFYAFILQFLLATFVIRVEAGYQLFDFLGKQVTTFIENADAGAQFVFGETFTDHFYVFKITSIIIFLGSVINVLYYYGAMQYIISKIAWLMQKCLDTTAAESMNSAANIFVGISEAPLMIMPLIPKMTTSELHAVLVGGFATMAGSVLASFIKFGVPANHLIAASVMAAPGALGFAKLLLPETHKTKTSWDTVKNVQLPEQHNAIDALMTGAGNALKICGYLIANLIAFISVLSFLDSAISWAFNMVHHPEVNFQYILGLVFYPFAAVTGISLRDCLMGSKLIGIKVSLNEFIAYQRLGQISKLRNALIENGTFPLYLNGTLTLPNNTEMLWDDSSIVILTYALCGFANFGSMGIALAAIGVFAPSKKKALVNIAFRALIGGNMVSLMTASIAGLLYDPDVVGVSQQSSNGTLI